MKMGSNLIFFSGIILALCIWLLKLNIPLFYLINSLHTVFPNSVWFYINYITEPKHFILPVILIILSFRKNIIRVLALIILYYIVFYILKIAFHEARPFIGLAANTFFWLSSHSQADLAKSYQSFPSGHVGLCTIFIFTIIKTFKTKYIINIILFLLLLLTMFSRICSGWHWPLDVLASLLISYVLVRICLNKE